MGVRRTRVCGQVGDWRLGGLVECLVRPVPVVVGRVLVEYASQVGFVDDERPVEKLPAEGSDEAFAERSPWVPAVEW